LSSGERELIAAYVSGLNDCTFCSSSHSAFAAAQLDAGMPLVTGRRPDAWSSTVTQAGRPSKPKDRLAADHRNDGA
jgi:hypothetical protein